MVGSMYHDTPGVTGYPPQSTVFNRELHLAGVSYGGSLGVEAHEWFHETEIMNEWVRKRLEDTQRKRVDNCNRGRREPKEYSVGEWLWYRHPIDGSSELHGAWIRPFEVRMRTSTWSYVIWTAKREHSRVLPR